jgi:hypothetical protein
MPAAPPAEVSADRGSDPGAVRVSGSMIPMITSDTPGVSAVIMDSRACHGVIEGAVQEPGGGQAVT